MEIHRYDIYLPGEENPISIGLNIQKKFGLTHANIFSLLDNEGPKTSDYLFQIAKQIVDEILRGESLDNINWSFTAGTQTSRVNFTSVRGMPYKIDLSNQYAVQFDDSATSFPSEILWDIDKYSERYRGVTPIDAGKGRSMSRDFNNSPKTIFQVPCSHPDAKGGFFYCEPPYMNTSHMTDDFDYVLVDTKKVMARLQQDDPGMLDHAAWKFDGTTPSEILKRNSIDTPKDTGHWAFDEHGRGLTFCAGQAGVIKLIQELDVPYFPVTISKEQSQALRRVVGYDGVSSEPIRPAFINT